MKQPDDFIRVKMVVAGNVDLTLDKIPELDWPPPERLVLCGPDEEGIVREPTDDDHPSIILKRVSMSEWPDDVAASSDHLARGAQYEYELEPIDGWSKGP